jgi:hypothetical protein
LFYETRRFFEGIEITGIRGSLTLIVFQQPGTNGYIKIKESPHVDHIPIEKEPVVLKVLF